MELIVNSSWEQNAPQMFAINVFIDGHTYYCRPQDIAALKYGPKHKFYNEAWSRVQKDFDMNGKIIEVYMDDIWIVEAGEVDNHVDADISYLKSIS